MPQSVTVNIRISSEEFKKLYEGTASIVNCVARDGRRIKFPAKILQPYLTHDGISGSFLINFDLNNKFESIERVH